MSDSSPWFYALCNEADKVDAFAASLCAANDTWQTWPIRITSIDPPHDRLDGSLPLMEVVAAVRAAFAAGTHVRAYVDMKLRSGRLVPFHIDCYSTRFEQRYPSWPLRAFP